MYTVSSPNGPQENLVRLIRLMKVGLLQTPSQHVQKLEVAYKNQAETNFIRRKYHWAGGTKLHETFCRTQNDAKNNTTNKVHV